MVFFPARTSKIWDPTDPSGKWLLIEAKGPKSSAPVLLEAINKNAFILFLLVHLPNITCIWRPDIYTQSNVATSLINLNIQTMFVGNMKVMCLLCAYLMGMYIFAWLFRSIQLRKMWGRFKIYQTRTPLRSVLMPRLIVLDLLTHLSVKAAADDQYAGLPEDCATSCCQPQGSTAPPLCTNPLPGAVILIYDGGAWSHTAPVHHVLSLKAHFKSVALEFSLISVKTPHVIRLQLAILRCSNIWRCRHFIEYATWVIFCCRLWPFQLNQRLFSNRHVTTCSRFFW